jgi:hypothetical protein
MACAGNQAELCGGGSEHSPLVKRLPLLSPGIDGSAPLPLPDALTVFAQGTKRSSRRRLPFARR